MSANKVLWLGRVFYWIIGGLIVVMTLTSNAAFFWLTPYGFGFGSMTVFAILLMACTAISPLSMIGEDYTFLAFIRFLPWAFFGWMIGEVVFYHLVFTNSLTLSMITSFVCGIVGGGLASFLDFKIFRNAWNNCKIKETNLIFQAWFTDISIVAVITIALIYFKFLAVL